MSLIRTAKASDVFLEYVQSYFKLYLEEYPHATLEEIEVCLQVPWMLWNAVVMQEQKNKVDFIAGVRPGQQYIVNN